MSREQRLRQVLEKEFSPTLLGVENESHQHSVPPGSETHFKVLIVSEIFAGLGRVDRQRKVNEALAAEFKQGLHALTQKTLTPAEYEVQKDHLNFVSPACLGGSKVKAWSQWMRRAGRFVSSRQILSI